MSKSKRGKAGLAAIAAVLVVAIVAAVPSGAAAGVGQVVTIKSTLRISVYGYKGTVKAANPNCVEERTVVLKQKGHGILGRTTSEAKGKWEVSPEDLKFKGQLPYKIYAEVKPLSQGTAGTIYKCLGATSKTIEIAGG
jgi:hypothetical protein